MLPGEYRLGIEREFDPVLGWRHRSNFTGGIRSSEFVIRFTTNSKGLRDEEIAYERPPGGLRALVLGDSFVAGAHVELEQTMSKQLQSILREELAPRPVEVINAGVAGYGTAQEYLYLDTEGHKYQPDIVLLVLFLGNDLFDNVRSEDARWDRPTFSPDANGQLQQLSRPKRGTARPRWDEFLVRNSTAYNFLQSGVLSKLGDLNRQTGEGGHQPANDFQIYEQPQSKKLRKAWEITELLLAATARRSEELGAPLILVGAPSFRQLDPVRFDELLRAERLDPSHYDVEAPNRLLAEAAARIGVPYVDLLPYLRQAQTIGDGDMFYPRNTHWAPAGQRAVAHTLAPLLKERGHLVMAPGEHPAR